MKQRVIFSVVAASMIGGCADGGSGGAQLGQIAGAVGSVVGTQIGGVAGQIVEATASTVQAAGTEQASLGFAGEREAAKGFDAKIVKSGKLVDDPVAQAYLDSIVRNLSPNRKNPQFTITARIINDPAFNAFTPGGGYLYINSGLISGLENEAQLAMVIAHEIAHIDEGHISNTRLTNVAAQGAGRFAEIGLEYLGLGGGAGRLAGTGAGLGIKALQNTFSRSQETEADKTGFDTLVASGYDARQASRTFEIIGAAGGPENKLTNALFSSHPMSVERQQALSALSLGHGQGKHGGRDYIDRMSGVLILTADSMIEQGEFVAAEKIMTRARAASGQNARVVYNLGRISLKKRSAGQASLEAAIAYFEEAVAINPSFADAHHALGMAYLEASDKDKALQSLRQYVALRGGSFDRREVQGLIDSLEQRV